MSKQTVREKDGLEVVVSVRISTEDEALLERVAKRHPLARRGAVAREALRRGLEALEAEGRR